MTLTIETLARYLGRQASVLLADPPFKDWAFERSLETGLEKLRIDYVFAHNGMDFVCDEDDKVDTIFFYADKSRCFKEGVQELPFSANRREVIARLGSPSKSGGKISDPILGEYGAWDLFARPGYAIHVEYRLDVDVINKITLMRADVVP
jgi:hypothetical protein